MPYLEQIDIHQLRNIETLSWSCNPKINLIFGKNGSGKTSLLEAINLLALGRSFRSHKTKTVIAHNEKQLLVRGRLVSDLGTSSIGIQKNNLGQTLLRCNGKSIMSIGEIAKLVPIRVIDASAFSLIEGAPSQRRSFLDWLVFHVKPQFNHHWALAQKSIKQRNSLLRQDKLDVDQIQIWGQQLGQAAQAMHELRFEVFELFKQELQPLLDQTLKLGLVTLEYQAGWDTEKDFSEVLMEDWQRDVRDGYTHRGPHRADIAIKIDGKQAADVLSRGQEKTLICLLHIAQAHCFHLKNQQKCLFLIDDMPSELDKNFQGKLAKLLKEYGGQVFITGIDYEELISVWGGDGDFSQAVSMFHVEHGRFETSSDCLV